MLIQLEESLAVRALSKFVYKEDQSAEKTATTSKVLRQFFLELESGLAQEQFESSPVLESRLSCLLSLLLAPLLRWSLKDVLFSLQFYTNQNLTEFLCELLKKAAASDPTNPCAQVLATNILQVLVAVQPEERLYADSVENLAAFPAKLPCTPLILVPHLTPTHHRAC